MDLYLFRILTRRGFPRSDYVCTKCLHTQGFEFWGLGIPHWHVTKMIIKVSPKHLFWWLVMLLCWELWGTQPAAATQWQYSQPLVRSFQNFVIPVLALDFPFQISVNLIPKLAMSPLEMKTYPNGKDQDEKKFNQVWKYSNNDPMVYKTSSHYSLVHTWNFSPVHSVVLTTCYENIIPSLQPENVQSVNNQNCYLWWSSWLFPDWL